MRTPPLPILALAAALAAGAGCSSGPRLPGVPIVDRVPFVYRIDVQQGNVVTQEMLAQLKVGMEKSKVRFIMGTPLIIDTFHTNRWDYLYSLQEGSSNTREQRRITLFFEDDKLARVEGDVTPATGKLVVEQRERSAMVDVPGQYQPSLVDKLKGTVGLTEEAPVRKSRKDEADDKRSLMEKLKGSVGLGEDGKDGKDATTADESEDKAAAAEAPEDATAGPAVDADAQDAADAEVPEAGEAPADASDDTASSTPDAGDAEEAFPTPAPLPEASPPEDAPAPSSRVVDVPADAPHKQKKGFFSRLFGGGDDQATAQRKRAGGGASEDDTGPTPDPRPRAEPAQGEDGPAPAADTPDGDDGDNADRSTDTPDEAPADDAGAQDEPPLDDEPQEAIDLRDSSGDYRDPTEPSTGGF